MSAIKSGFTIALFGLCMMLLSPVLSFAQKESSVLAIDIKTCFGNDGFELNRNYISTQHDTLRVEQLKFYISGLTLQYKNGTLIKESNSYHLIDLEDSSTLILLLKNAPRKGLKAISFNVGVDSLASVSGALGGDLDPMKGMYWAWQSGYINFKIEGSSPSCKTRKNQFQFHIGGYLPPYQALQHLSLPVKSKRGALSIKVNLAKLFESISLSKQNSIMIPSKAALEIAQQFSQVFSL